MAARSSHTLLVRERSRIERSAELLQPLLSPFRPPLLHHQGQPSSTSRCKAALLLVRNGRSGAARFAHAAQRTHFLKRFNRPIDPFFFLLEISHYSFYVQYSLLWLACPICCTSY